MSSSVRTCFSVTFATAADGTALYTAVRTPEVFGPQTKTLVLCDGIGCDGFILRYFLPALAPSAFNVVAVLGGQGR